MSDEVQQGEQLQGRRVRVAAWGADLAALEMDALDKAREFFGKEARLEIVQDYAAQRYGDYEPERRFNANITVREIA